MDKQIDKLIQMLLLSIGLLFMVIGCRWVEPVLNINAWGPLKPAYGPILLSLVATVGILLVVLAYGLWRERK